MVSMSTTPKPLETEAPASVVGGGGEEGGGGGKQQKQGVVVAPMAVPAPVAGAAAAAAAAEEARKVRKPYTITKSRESWTEPEHDKFLEALQLFDRDWKKIEAFVGSKTVIQIRSHAQKYFLKVQKNGTGEHLPPPRPKRKAAHPYPQKASKSAPVVSQSVSSQQHPPTVRDQGGVISMGTSTVVPNANANAVVPSWDNALVQPMSASHTQGPGAVATNNCSSSIESQSGTWPTSEAVEQDVLPPRAMPDFAQVYNFLGSVFDPDTSGHLQRLKAMDPIDVETVLLLMRNLSVNLTSPNFEAHRKLLSSYGSGGDQIKSEGMESLGSPESCHLPAMVTSE